MQNRNAKYEFVALLIFLVSMTLLLTNGFMGRIDARENNVDVYQQIAPMGEVLNLILEDYVREADLEDVVNGALMGMMSSLDRNSSFISKDDLQKMREETQGEFEGIGVSIKLDDNDNIMVFQPIHNSPAEEAGILPFDLIIKIGDVSTEGMSLNDAANLIRGPKGTSVDLTLLRQQDGAEPREVEVSVKRANVPLESIKEARLLEGGVGYVRIGDFKDTTARDLKERLKEFLEQDMRAFVLDLRWNPGGLLTASQQVCELFLPKASLVTYTRGRVREDGKANGEDMELYTERRPVLPEGMPMIVLVNDQTASSSEIVTGALQYYKRALVLGEKTFGKGSVQTIIPVPPERESALRLTTALYYTPADVTIDHQGILPDIEVAMSDEEERALGVQMYYSYKDNPEMMDQQNHGSVTGNVLTVHTEEEMQARESMFGNVDEVLGEEAVELLKEYIERTRGTKETIDDKPLLRAVEIITEDSVWENLIQKYHRDVHETQMAADVDSVQELSETEQALLAPTTEEEQGATEAETNE